MLTIAQIRYQEMARASLAEHGITAHELAKAATPGLKRFRLDLDMGEAEGEARQAEPGEDPLLPYAELLVDRLVTWPPITELYGIRTAGMLEEAICFMAGLEDVDIEVASLFLTRQMSSQIIKQIPAEHFTTRICDASLMVRPDSFEDIPEQFKTREMCLKAVKLLISNAQQIPRKLLDAEMAMQVIDIAPPAIIMLPESVYTPELIQRACSRHPGSLPFIPDHHLTPALLEAKALFIEQEMERKRQRDDQ